MPHRRELLQVGCSSFFGLGLSAVMGRQARAASMGRPAKSVLLVFLGGGGSHIDMFDPKPEVAEVKGETPPGDDGAATGKSKSAKEKKDDGAAPQTA